MYKLWLFDFDNTIARLEPEVDWAGGRPVLERYLRSVGAPDELFERIPRGNLPLYDAYRTLILANSDRPKIEKHPIDTTTTRLSPFPQGKGLGVRLPRITHNLRKASEIIEKIELAGVDSAQPLEGAVETLAALKKTGAMIAIVTSNSSKTVSRWFDKHGGASIDAIVGRDTLLGLKPAPDMLLRALEIFSVDSSETAFVGDSEADLQAAQSCEVRFYGIAPNESARDRLLAAGSTEIFASPAALAIHLNTSPVISRERRPRRKATRR
jgi:HAD superfamily hydrolase (TIGR01509 family)